MKKEQKKQIVKEFVEIFSESGFYLMNFKGLNVSEITELRSMLRKANVSMRVVKNTLAKRALKHVGIESLDSFFVGPTGVIWSAEDSITPVRVLSQFLEKYEKGTIKAGLIDGSLVKDYEIERISKLPSKHELYTNVASSLNVPIVKLARVLTAVPKKFVRILDAVRNKKSSETA